MTKAFKVRTELILLVALAMRLASAPTANLSFLVLAVYALLGPRRAIQAIAFSWLFTMANPGLAPPASAGTIGRFLVLYSAALSALVYSGFGRQHFRASRFATLTTVVGLFLLFHSATISVVPDVSILKALTWSITAVTLVSLTSQLSPVDAHRLLPDFARLSTAILLCSLPLLFLPSGYLRNGHGFQGVLNHPQPFGVLMAYLGTISISRMLSQPRPNWSSVLLSGASFAAILLSETRTAGFAVVLALAASLLITTVIKRQKLSSAAPGLRSRRFYAVAMLMLLIGAVSASQIAEVAVSFITKSGRADVSGIASAYDASRGGLMRDMLANIEDRPLFGLGFGVASDPGRMEIERDPIFGFPVGAPIEKGVTPVAVVEEVGFVGALLVGFWFFVMLLTASAGGLVPLATVLVIFGTNLGEATFFSPGGMGLISLVLAICAFATGRKQSPSRSAA